MRSEVVVSLPSAANALLRFNLSLLFCRKMEVCCKHHYPLQHIAPTYCYLGLCAMASIHLDSAKVSFNITMLPNSLH